MGTRGRMPGLFVIALAMTWGTLAQGAAADVYKPTTTIDHLPNGCTAGECTLREAITAANGNSGRDRIVLKGGRKYDVTYAPGTVEDDNETSDLDINDHLTIVGRGKKLAILDADHLNRVVDVGPSHDVSVKLVHLWVRNGFSTEGAGIRAGQAGTAALTLARCRVTGSRTVLGGSGGGVQIENADSSDSTLNIARSTISGNKSSGQGAGIAAIDIGAVTVTGSTISGNFAGYEGGDEQAGGIYLINNDTNLKMTNSTVADNRATGEGAGIDAFDAAVVIRSSTIVRNHADTNNSGSDTGGGLSLGNNASASVVNSIVALNTAFGTGFDDCASIASATIVPAGRNLFSKESTGCDEFDVPATIIQANPHLGKLRANGGPTKTIALLSGSKAINRASAASPARDQRGHRRRNPDIGAFERG